MRKELDPFFSELTKGGLEKYFKLNKKVWILINRKGYDSGVICRHCGHIPQCDRCSVAINYHQTPGGEKLGICHICKMQYPSPDHCTACRKSQLKNYGLGIQKLAQILSQEYWKDTILISSETVNSEKKIERLQQELADQKKKGNTPVLLGTSLLSTPIKDRDLDLVVILDADIGLNIPDYNAAEKNFYFLYETLSKHRSPTFLLQSFNPEHHSIRNACKLDPKNFWEQEHPFRATHHYPPFGEICVLLYKDEVEEKVFKKIDTLYKELIYLQQRYQLPEIEIYSTPPLIYKIFGKYRYHIILKGANVRSFMDIIYPKLDLSKRGFKVDWMATSSI